MAPCVRCGLKVTARIPYFCTPQSPARGGMQHFRLYFFDDRKHVTAALDLFAESDEDAVAQALDKATGQAMELWREARRIRRFEKRE
jgi:hypothetical protein